jgi:hypothetical protein
MSHPAISPSVREPVSRRSILEGLAVAALAAIGAGNASAGSPTLGGDMSQLDARIGTRRVADEISYEEFATRAKTLAKELKAGVNEDGYLFAVAALAARLTSVPAIRLERFGSFDPPVEFGPLFVEPPIFVIQWYLSPGAVLRPHNHPNANVVTLGLEGECRIRNYELDGSAPAFSSTTQFRVRQTHDDIITPGRINTLSSTRDNIHEFRAGRLGARGIDIGTMVAKQDAFAFVDIEANPVDPDTRVFRAKWVTP